MNEGFYIYALIDPTNDKVRYIGMTSRDLNDRLSEHIYEAKENGKNSRNHRCNWIRKILSIGLRPIIDIIELTDIDNWEDREKYWISYFGRDNLVNGTDGGEGNIGWSPSQEQRENASRKLKGKKAWNKGIPMREESKRKLSESHIGQVAWNRGIPMTEERKNNLSDLKRISKYRRVVWFGKEEKWAVKVKIDGERKYFGNFDSEEIAGEISDIVCIFFYGDKYDLNFPDQRENYISYLNQYDIEDIKELRQVIKNYIEERSNYA